MSFTSTIIESNFYSGTSFCSLFSQSRPPSLSKTISPLPWSYSTTPTNYPSQSLFPPQNPVSCFIRSKYLFPFFPIFLHMILNVLRVVLFYFAASKFIPRFWHQFQWSLSSVAGCCGMIFLFILQESSLWFLDLSAF